MRTMVVSNSWHKAKNIAEEHLGQGVPFHFITSSDMLRGLEGYTVLIDMQGAQKLPDYDEMLSQIQERAINVRFVNPPSSPK